MCKLIQRMGILTQFAFQNGSLVSSHNLVSKAVMRILTEFAFQRSENANEYPHTVSVSKLRTSILMQFSFQNPHGYPHTVVSFQNAYGYPHTDFVLHNDHRYADTVSFSQTRRGILTRPPFRICGVGAINVTDTLQSLGYANVI